MFVDILLNVFVLTQICILTSLAQDTHPTRTPQVTPSNTSSYSPSDVWIPRVVNGYPAKLGDAPYQVALKSLYNKRDRTYKTFCGASIIGPTKLITAAHCFEAKGTILKFIEPGKVPPEAFSGKYAVAGNLYNVAVYSAVDGPNGQWRSLHSVYRPPGFKFPEHDIAVAFTKRPYQFNKYVAPIKLATRNTDYNGECLVSGYGRVGRFKGNQSEALVLAHLQLMPRKVCTSVHRKNMDRYVCSSSILADVAKGDSGGPLVCARTGDPAESDKGVLVGIVSGHSPDRGSFHTRVTRYMNFIQASDATTNAAFKFNIKMIIGVAIFNINSILFLY